jgi:uncharacterized protein YhjY with autotransporter beta-barrel domain
VCGWGQRGLCPQLRNQRRAPRALAFGSVISGQYTYMGFSSFTENGAESLNLRVGGQSYNSMRMNVGGRIAYTWRVNNKYS